MDGPKSLVLYAVRQVMRKYPLHREDMMTATCGAVGQMLHCIKVGRPMDVTCTMRYAIADVYILKALRMADSGSLRFNHWESPAFTHLRLRSALEVNPVGQLIDELGDELLMEIRNRFTVKKGLRWVAGLAYTYHCDEALLLVLLTRLQKELDDGCVNKTSV